MERSKKIGKSVRFCQEEKEELKGDLEAMDSNEEIDGLQFDSILPGRHDTHDNTPNVRPSGIERVSTYKYSRATTLQKSEVITKDSF